MYGKLVLNTLGKMHKTEFCLNIYTDGRNTNLGNYEKRIVQGNPFTGIDSLYADGKKTRLYVSNKGIVSLYTSASDNDSSWVKKGDVITNADMAYYINGVKAGKVIWFYESDNTGPFMRLQADGRNIAFFRVSGTYPK